MATGSPRDPERTSAPLLGEPLPVELMNTVWADRTGLHDALVTPADVRAWLAGVGARLVVPGPDVAGWAASASPEEVDDLLAGLRGLRDAARGLAARRTDDPRGAGRPRIGDAAAVARVNTMAATAPEWPRLAWPDGAAPQVEVDSPAATGRLLLAHLARETIGVVGGPAGDSLRACLAPGCVLYFVRHHPRREWCSDACGNRARQARHYQRSRG